MAKGRNGKRKARKAKPAAAPPKAAAPCSADPAPSAERSSKVLRDLGLALIATMAGVLVTWVLAPNQEVRGDQAVRDDLKEALAGQPPLRPHVIYDLDSTNGSIHAFAKPLDEATQAMLLRIKSSNIEARLKAHGPLRIADATGIRGPRTQSLTRLRISLEGNRTKPVQIQSIKARITKRSEPWAGALVEVRPQGADETQKLGFDLDSADMEARIVQDDGTFGTQRYIDVKDLKLEYGEPAALIVHAVTATCYCEWVIDVTTRSDGKVERQTIDDNGRPFRITAFAHRYESAFVWRHAPESGFRTMPPTRPADG
ncbi:hypothetical protein GCM10020001_098360 [Nonomuraea salmonea]